MKNNDCVKVDILETENAHIGQNGNGNASISGSVLNIISGICDGQKTVTSNFVLADILIEQAMRDEAIIADMKKAVLAGDKDAVFELARQLL